ncbi:adenylosuccinate lyase [Chlamydiota bacterium]
MIERYSTPEMVAIWSDENKYSVWKDIELLVCEALAKDGEMPQEDFENIKKNAHFSVERINEIEKITHHDVIAFTQNLAEHIGPSSRFIHFGLTSSDVVDTSLSVLMKQAITLIITELEDLKKSIGKKAQEHKYTLMIGRSHGVHAEPLTFGFKLALFYEELGRNLIRLQRAQETISFGKISGAVGTHAHLDPYIEEFVCDKLGLKAAPISNQVLQRDRHAYYLSTLALVGATLEKIALEIRHLHRTEVREAEEYFAKGQKGSSAMPHKKNPIICERVCGLARILRSNALVGLENVALWHERDISHSSAERIIIPDSTTALHYMLRKMIFIIDNLVVYPDTMLSNLNITKGLYFSQKILLLLIQKGLTRENAYKLVQVNAMKTWKENKDFSVFILNDPEIKKHLSDPEIKDALDIRNYTANIELTFKKLGL